MIHLLPIRLPLAAILEVNLLKLKQRTFIGPPLWWGFFVI
jgi:hypothetical protein